jgi:hypothetical protein
MQEGTTILHYEVLEKLGEVRLRQACSTKFKHSRDFVTKGGLVRRSIKMNDQNL